MEIYFLSPNEAYPRLHNLYINKGCTKAHYNNVLTFDSNQKVLLVHLMRQINKLFAPYPFSIDKIEFILLDKGVYWDFPFTWGKTMIVITPKIFDKPHKQIRKILIHEWVHLQQRKNLLKFNKYYNKLGFSKKYIDFGALNSYILRNPDADNYEWIWKNRENGKIYAPVALLQSCEFKSVLVELPESVYGDDVKAIIHNIDDIPSYYERFGTKRQLYHPNEITAHLIADFISDKTKYIQIDYEDLLLCLT